MFFRVLAFIVLLCFSSKSFAHGHIPCFYDVGVSQNNLLIVLSKALDKVGLMRKHCSQACAQRINELQYWCKKACGLLPKKPFEAPREFDDSVDPMDLLNALIIVEIFSGNEDFISDFLTSNAVLSELKNDTHSS